MDISFVIVNWNTKDLLLDCLASIYNTLGKRLVFEIFVVDNASSDESVEAVHNKYPLVEIIQNRENIGFAAANNRAFHKMKGRYALLLNTDALLTEGAVELLFDFMEKNPDVGMSCGQLLNKDGSKQNSIANFPSLLTLLVNETVLRILLPERYPSKRKEYLEPVDVDSCIGACMIVRKTTMDDIGFLDEKYFFYMEETDWAYRAKQNGWRVCLVPYARIYHLQGKSAGYNPRARTLFYISRSIYYKKWHPGKLFFMHSIVFFRLLVNVILNVIPFVLSLGFHKRSRAKLHVYFSLIGLYMRGFPSIR